MQDITYFAYYEKENPADRFSGKYLGFWTHDEIFDDLHKLGDIKNIVLETFDNYKDCADWMENAG